jgi:hypothetical protein
LYQRRSNRGHIVRGALRSDHASSTNIASRKASRKASRRTGCATSSAGS